jgi:hypothetical protein
MDSGLAEVLTCQSHLAVSINVDILDEAHVAVQETPDTVKHTICWSLDNSSSLVSNLSLNCIKYASENPNN